MGGGVGGGLLDRAGGCWRRIWFVFRRGGYGGRRRWRRRSVRGGWRRGVGRGLLGRLWRWCTKRGGGVSGLDSSGGFIFFWSFFVDKVGRMR